MNITMDFVTDVHIGLPRQAREVLQDAEGMRLLWAITRHLLLRLPMMVNWFIVLALMRRSRETARHLITNRFIIVWFVSTIMISLISTYDTAVLETWIKLLPKGTPCGDTILRLTCVFPAAAIICGMAVKLSIQCVVALNRYYFYVHAIHYRGSALVTRTNLWIACCIGFGLINGALVLCTSPVLVDTGTGGDHIKPAADEPTPLILSTRCVYDMVVQRYLRLAHGVAAAALQLLTVYYLYLTVRGVYRTLGRAVFGLPTVWRAEHERLQLKWLAMFLGITLLFLISWGAQCTITFYTVIYEFVRGEVDADVLTVVIDLRHTLLVLILVECMVTPFLLLWCEDTLLPALARLFKHDFHYVILSYFVVNGFHLALIIPITYKEL